MRFNGLTRPQETSKLDSCAKACIVAATKAVIIGELNLYIGIYLHRQTADLYDFRANQTRARGTRATRAGCLADYVVRCCGLQKLVRIDQGCLCRFDRKLLKMAYKLLRVARASAELRVDKVANPPTIQDPGRRYVACIALAFYWRYQKSWTEAMHFVGDCLGLDSSKAAKWAIILCALVRPRRLPAQGTMSSVSHQHIEC